MGKLVEVRVTKAHRGLQVGEVVRADRRAVEQGWAELVGAPPAPEAAPGPVAAMSAAAPAPVVAQPVADEAPSNQPAVPEAPAMDVEFKPAAPLDEAVAKPPRERAPKKVAVEKEPKPKPPLVRKGRYNRRDLKAE